MRMVRDFTEDFAGSKNLDLALVVVAGTARSRGLPAPAPPNSDPIPLT